MRRKVLLNVFAAVTAGLLSGLEPGLGHAQSDDAVAGGGTAQPKQAVIVKEIAPLPGAKKVEEKDLQFPSLDTPLPT